MSPSTEHPSYASHPIVKPKIDDLINHLMAPVPPIGPEMLCEEVYRIFAADKSIQSIAVVSNGRPVGLVHRFALIDLFSRRFFRELYGRKSIYLIMEKS